MLPDGLDDLYQEIILDHYKRPRNRGALGGAELKAEGYNPFCGDQITITANIGRDGRITEVGLEGQGCAISQASASMMSDHLKGHTLEEITSLSHLFREMMHDHEVTAAEEEQLQDLAALQGVKKFPVRIKCALLAWATVDDAIAEYSKTHPSN
jgi:nitrogen fixation NifU-like protein